MKRSKKQAEVRDKIDRTKRYSLEEAVQIIKANGYCKFDETVELVARLGVNPKHADQMVRGTCALPNGTGKKVRVLVFAAGDKETEAKEAGADFVGTDEFVTKIQGGWLDFDVAVATPDMMKIIGRLGKVLGSRGLMPNPKAGTVTMDISRTVKELKAGRIEYRVDKQANIAIGVGKLSFSEENIVENVKTFINALVKAKPASAKGTYMKGISISSTMGVGIKLDHQGLLAELKR